MRLQRMSGAGVGAYVEAKQVLALCLQPGAEGYKEEIVEKTFPEVMR